MDSIVQILGLILMCYLLIRSIRLSVIEVKDARKTWATMGRTRTVASCLWTYGRNWIICGVAVLLFIAGADEIASGSYNWRWFTLCLVALAGLGIFWPRGLKEDGEA